MSSGPHMQAEFGNAAISLRRTGTDAVAQYQAEMWCEFDCVAYVFTGADREEISERLKAARGGEHSWDYVRPLSREELYAGLV